MKMLKKDHYKTLRANLKRYKNSLDIEVKKDDFYENEIEQYKQMFEEFE